MTDKGLTSNDSAFRAFRDAAASRGVVEGCAGGRRAGFDSPNLAKLAVASIHGDTADSACARRDAACRELAAFDKAREEEKKARAEAEMAATAQAASAVPDSVPDTVDTVSARRGVLARISSWFRRRSMTPALLPAAQFAPQVSRAELLQRMAVLEARVGELAAIEAEYADMLDAEFQNHLARVSCLPLYEAGAALAGGV